MKNLYLVPLILALIGPPVSASESLPPTSPKPKLGAQAQSPAKDQEIWTGSAEQKLWGLMTVWAEAKFNFPYFDRIPDVDWDGKVREYIPRVLSAESLDNYYDVLMEFAPMFPSAFSIDWPRCYFLKPLERKRRCANINILHR
jgi:hypothetical protein